MVNDAEAICDRIVPLGGQIVQSLYAELPTITACFSDPAGNVLGIYQHSA